MSSKLLIYMEIVPPTLLYRETWIHLVDTSEPCAIPVKLLLSSQPKDKDNIKISLTRTEQLAGAALHEEASDRLQKSYCAGQYLIANIHYIIKPSICTISAAYWFSSLHPSIGMLFPEKYNPCLIDWVCLSTESLLRALHGTTKCN